MLVNLFLTAGNVTEQVVKQTENAVQTGNFNVLIDKLADLSVQAGKSIIAAVLIFIVGRFIISLLNKLLARMLERKHVEMSIQSFLKSLVNILLTILLIITVVSALGVNTMSFAALLASAGVAVGMALSGNLQNFAGGLIILLFKPYKAGDWVEAQGVQGSVTAVEIFHTIITTADNKVIYVPNGSMSSDVVINYSRMPIRRVDWEVGVEYGQDLAAVEACVKEILARDARVLATPEPFIALAALADSSVNVCVRAWTNTENYWSVLFDVRKAIYQEFNKAGIGFPFPQLTVHQA